MTEMSSWGPRHGQYVIYKSTQDKKSTRKKISYWSEEEAPEIKGMR